MSSTKPLSAIDVLRYIGMVTREVSTREYEGLPARVLSATCAYDTTIDDVWDAITNPERLPRWFLPVSGDLRLGGRYQLEGNASGQITTCDAPRVLNLTWEFGGQISWVQVRLNELSDGGTSLRLEHIAHVPEDFWNQYGPGAVGVGWDLSLLALGRYLETGAAIDPKEGADWPTTEDGKKFVSRSSDEWCGASIAAGTPEAAAREAAGRTTAFYTGQG
ncbi:MAG TPA: SRPBCC family protein [Blastocatellia bacterium]|nr:SRPBCC family protein [Blastocatellia bacterium]